MLDSVCPLCRVLQDNQDRIVQTTSWDVRLAHQQMRPGRCITVLKRHCAAEIELSDQEWQELRQLRKKLHPAILSAFGATHFNTCILMNGAWDKSASTSWGNAHVHYWDVPRYGEPKTIGNTLFVDPAYPYLNADEFSDHIPDIPEMVRQHIIAALQARF